MVCICVCPLERVSTIFSRLVMRFSASFGRSDTAVLFALARVALFSAGFSNTHCVPFMRHRRHDVSLPAGSHSHRFLPRRQAMQALLPLLAVGPELGNTLGCDDCCCCCCRGGCRAGAWAWLDPFMSFPCSHGLSSFRAGLSCTGLVSVHEEEYALFSRP